MTAELTEGMIRELARITTRNEAGRHFTEWSKHYDALESLGLIKIDRPIHQATGIPYGQDQWTVEVTDDGHHTVDDYPDLMPDYQSETQQLDAEFAKRIGDAGHNGPEEGHAEADDLLCELLTRLGFEKTVKAFNDQHKWYA